MKNTGDAAFDFLCKRNFLGIEQSNYVWMLMEFQDIFGDDGIKKLAGFYFFVIRELEGDEKQHNALREVFNHDLYGRHQTCMLPRSDNYMEYWEKEVTA